jgi:hypothetical protein
MRHDEFMVALKKVTGTPDGRTRMDRVRPYKQQ